MKHCAKKLLGLAFALALCLAVGGTALAETPVLAAVLAALPGQEMLADEPNVTAEPGTNSIDKLATEGYQVTIPTTVDVKSGENKGTLEVNAKLKQYRTLNIGIASENDWKLKYQGADPGTTTPEVKYQLPQDMDMKLLANNNGYWLYQPDEKTDNKLLSFTTTTMTPSASPEKDMTRVENSSYTLPITIPYPEQATMSGTYSDTVSFEFKLEKLCVTYTINVYKQKLELTNDGAHVKAVDVVDANGDVIGGAIPDETVTLEYKSSDKVTKTWTRTRPDGAAGEEDARCWEDLPAVEMTPSLDYKPDKTSVTFNKQLNRKWYWLDVNGATDYTNEYADGNQGNKIAGFVNMQVSVDNGTTWSNWFWQEPGDDYWGKFPYGIRFRLGLHHVKDGYVYEMSGTGVRIIANKQDTVTKPGAEETDTAGYTTTYYVYEDTLTGEPTGTDSRNNVRYCYIPCYKKGITYFANGGTGGTEDYNEDNPYRSNMLYNETGPLETPDALGITAPADKMFAGWSTKPKYTKGDTLYQPGETVAPSAWETYTSAEMSKRPTGDTQKRELYAIWSTSYDITVQFEDKKGYTTNDGRPVLGRSMGKAYFFTLTGQVVADGADWTLDWNDPTVTAAIEKATTEAKRDVKDDRTEVDSKFVWKIGKYTDSVGHDFDFTKECTIKAADLQNGKRTLMIQRRRYLLSVISVDADMQKVNNIATKADEDEFGTFNVKINDSLNGGVTAKSHCQVGLNYGAKYTVSGMTGVGMYSPMGTEGAVVLKSLKAGDKIDSSWFTNGLVVSGQSYTGYMTGKQTDVHYYTSAGALAGDGYTGDPVRVAFNDSSNSTAKPGQNRAPAKKALTVRYHANFDPNEELALDLDPNPLLDDMDEDFGFDPDPLPEDVLDPTVEAIKTVTYKPDENVVLRNCMFKRGGYVFVGWNTEPDGTGRKYEVNGVPITDWAAGTTVDLYAQWKKPEHLKPVVDGEPQPGGADPAPTPQPGGADAAPQPGGVDDDFGIDPQSGGMDDAFGVDPQSGGMDDAFGVDPQPGGMDDAFGVDPQPGGMDDAFGV